MPTATYPLRPSSARLCIQAPSVSSKPAWASRLSKILGVRQVDQDAHAADGQPNDPEAHHCQASQGMPDHSEQLVTDLLAQSECAERERYDHGEHDQWHHLESLKERG